MKVLDLFWNTWLTIPLGYLKEYGGVDIPTGWALVGYKIGVIVFFLFIFFEIYSRLRHRLNRLMWDRGFLEGDEVAAKSPDQAFAEKIEAARNPERTIAPLIKSRQYQRAAEVYSGLNKPREAAKYFGKAGDRVKAATEWARAGYTVKAAKLLMRHGDYDTAARFFVDKERYADAARAYIKLNDMGAAAAMLVKARKYKDAAASFVAYFGANQEPADKQVKAAESCMALLDDPKAAPKIPEEQRDALRAAVAERFAAASRFDLAARLFREGGQPARAGEIYAKAGRLEEAAACYREAGNLREANMAGALYLESRQRWAEAGRAYAAAEEWRRAGDCYAKTNDAQRSADCYIRAGEYLGAGLALSHMGKYEEAVRALQRIKESDKAFDASRGLLGRCFYELHNYEHCAAALDNHLTGKRVETNNVDYFYMLALAYEQLGKLEKSQEILYKIRSVNVNYRDVTQRISNISSRISLHAGPGSIPVSSPSYQPTVKAEALNMVETLLGARYRLERELGRGGMGTVYLARDVQLDRFVALKFLGALVDESEDFRQRFIREAKAAARVNHPNIVHVYDMSASLGRAYIAMEYVEGSNLHTYLQQSGPLTTRETISLMVQACSALEAVHNAGIVHRDIKPDNILIAKGGLVKLSDFGLAKADTQRITGTNVIMGTPAYMAPEQARGHEADNRSDIYSLGLVMYEMLTGQAPFRDGDRLQRQQNEMPPDPITINNAIPAPMNDIIMKCIQKDPAARCQTAGQLLAALRTIPE